MVVAAAGVAYPAAGLAAAGLKAVLAIGVVLGAAAALKAADAGGAIGIP